MFGQTSSNHTFALHSHCASVRSVTCHGHLVASGGADDRIVVYDMKERKEHCMLTHHSSTINCMQFTQDGSHLISAGADGALCLVRVGNWQLEKIFEKAHKGGPAILDLAVHPSGKLLLTLGNDGSLYTWNLIKGRKAYIINLNNKSADPKGLNFIKWSPGLLILFKNKNMYVNIMRLQVELTLHWLEVSIQKFGA